MMRSILAIAGFWLLSGTAHAIPVYWNYFNDVSNPTSSPVYVTYATLEDMMNDENRLDSAAPDGVSSVAANNLVASGSDGATFWNFFNDISNPTSSPVYVTYSTLDDMMNDENRTDSAAPDGVSSVAANNLIASGSDGTSYWNFFNDVSNPTSSPVYVTYSTLDDMMNDENRMDSAAPDGVSSVAANNLVASGSDGTSYWNFFNDISNPTSSPVFVAYASLIDMINDENRMFSAAPDGVSSVAANNIIATGAFDIRAVRVPEPSSLALLGLGLALVVLMQSRRRKAELIPCR